MMRRGAIGLLGGLASALLLAGCDGVPSGETSHPSNPPSYKYRLTATVDTPEGERSGSSVIAVWWRSANPAFGSQASSGFTVQGEAVAVDLPKGQTLFVLLRGEGSPDWAAYGHEKVPVDQTPSMSRAEYMEAVADNRSIAQVPRTRPMPWGPVPDYPDFVRFRDIRDPRSVEQVDPDDLAKSFGPGYRLKSLTVQMTDDPVTTGIEKRLPKPPYTRKFVYHGEESKVLGLYDGKVVSERIDTESFIQGIVK